MKTTKIFLWSSPRNVSTALMYAFAERQDTAVYDEPLYAYYLNHTDADRYHPGAEEILNSMERDGRKVIEFMTASSKYPVQFFKNMTHHLVDLPHDFLHLGKNVILTREPREMILSFTKVIPQPNLYDLGYKQQYELLREFRERNIPYTVLDSRRFLLDPTAQLKKLCAFLKIPYDAGMSSWEKGPREEDGVWAEYWYENVHNSTGFMEYKERKGEVREDLIPLLKECNKFYAELMKFAL